MRQYLDKNMVILGQTCDNDLDILMLKVGQSQDISWLKTGQHTELRINFAGFSKQALKNNADFEK